MSLPVRNPLRGPRLRAFVIVAWIGAATTAINTVLPIFSDANGSLAYTREVVLLVHAIATLLPMIALGIAAFRSAPFAATIAIAFTSMEKFIELVGQSLILFPGTEVIGGVALSDLIAAVWNQLYFALWLCNSLAAAAAGWLMRRVLNGWMGWSAALSAWLAGSLTMLLILGPDYVNRFEVSVPMWLFAILFVTYRCSLALTLQRLARDEA